MADYTPDIEDEAAEAEPPESDDSDLHEEALERFDQIVIACQEERALNLRDRRFCTIPGAQWEGDWQDQFANSLMVEVNKTAAGVEKIIADYRSNRFSVNFRAPDDGGDKETAELLNGMFRADVAACAGQEAFDTAFEEAAQGGIGAFSLCNDWDDEYDPDNDDQRIRFVPIPDADQSVFWDPNAKRYDKADAKYCFVLTAMAREAYEDEYDDDPSNWPTGLLKTYYDWYTPDVVRVAKYYEVREKSGVLEIRRNVATGEERRDWAADLKPDDAKTLELEGWTVDRRRRGKRCTVWVTVMSGIGILEPSKQISGSCIPVIPMYGKRWFIDNLERTRGHVRLAVDPQRIYNAQISKLTETAALAPMERPIFTPEQIAGHEDSWAEANINRAPYALLNPIVGLDGSAMPAGPIGKVEPPQLSPVLAALVQITASDIAELTTADDGADEVKANVSAEAMDLAATRTDAKAEIYIDNFKKTMQRCGEVYMSMATDIYVEEGRNVETLDADGKQYGSATLLEAYADDNGYRIRHDIGRAKLKVFADVSEATKTRRDKTVRTLTTVAQIASTFDPDLAAVSLATAVVNLDGEGMDDYQAYVRAKLVQQGAAKPTKEEKVQLEQASQQQQAPSPEQELAQATTKQKLALADKAAADTKLSGANAVKALADAAHTRSLIHHSHAEAHIGILERFKDLMTPPEITQ